ncbi:Tetratricopeptide repeat protein [uncultured archaeon]|nr:Tetratricopeptide repeat protein [uncultured archaeon]
MINNANNEFKIGLIIAITGAFIAFFATLCQTVIPIYFSGDSDFSVIVHQIEIEPTCLNTTSESDALLTQISNFQEASNKNDSTIVEVRNIHGVINPYNHRVYLKTDSNDPNICVNFDKPEGDPDHFTAKISVNFKKSINKSLVRFPITIEGVGGNGKTRNCTIYITYLIPQDNLKWGDYYLHRNNFKEAIKYYDKVIEQCEQYTSTANQKVEALAWNNEGVALEKLGKKNESIQAYDKAVEISPN